MNIKKNNNYITRVCCLVNTLDVHCGWGRYSREIISRLKKSDDLDIKVLTEEKSDFQNSVHLLKKIRNPFFFILAIFRVRKFFRECDIIHCFDAYPLAFLATCANIGLGKKIIINIIGTYSVEPLDRPIKKFFLEWTYKKANNILSISNFTLNEVKKRVRISNYNLMYLGVDSEKFFPKKNKYYTDVPKKIISVGAVKFRKGYHVAIPAVAKIKNKYPDLKYYIIGKADNVDYLNKLKGMVKELSLENTVTFKHDIDDKELIQLYQDAHVFVLPSVNINNHFEGFGAVYLEANACAVPAIGCLKCGAEDAIIHGKTGYLVQQNNADALANTIDKVLSDPLLNKKLGENSRLHAVGMSWDKVVERIKSAYFKL